MRRFLALLLTLVLLMTTGATAEAPEPETTECEAGTERVEAEAQEAAKPAVPTSYVPKSIHLDIGGKKPAIFAGDLRDHITAVSRENKFYVLTASAFEENSYGGFFVTWLTEGVGVSGNMNADTHYVGNSDGALTLHELYTYISKVGDGYRILGDDYKYHYQHVQVYPSNSGFVLFRK